jgi:hypothetical protein
MSAGSQGKDSKKARFSGAGHLAAIRAGLSLVNPPVRLVIGLFMAGKKDRP